MARATSFAVAALAVLSLLGSPAGLWAQTGAVAGKVTDKGTGQPIAGAQVQVVGTTRGALTAADGRYRIPGVSAGVRQVRVVSLGFESATHGVTIPAGSTAELDFEVAASAVSLDQLVVTATGEQQRKRQMGSSVATISLAQGPPPATVTVTDVLNARAPGVSVMETSGTSGLDAPRIRIRGASSISLDNNPLLIVDGVRLDNNATTTALSINLGGQVTNRLDDIDPEDIESIEVLKGPAAAALYGTAAANGVIQITTKHGTPGASHWTFYAEGGSVSDKGGWPANYQALDANGKNCSLSSMSRNLCTIASVTSYNPLVAQSPFRTGATQKYGASVAGGSDAITYYVSGEWRKEDGVYTINGVRRANARANLSANVRPNLQLFASSLFINSLGTFPQNDNNTLGILPQGLLGTAFPDSLHNNGWFAFSPSTLEKLVTDQSINRFVNSVSADWAPLSWLRVNGIAGLDNENRFDSQTVQPQTIFFGTLPDGQRTSNRYEVNNYTFNANATATFRPWPALTSATSLGTQYEKGRLQSTNAFGAVLLPGTTSLNGTNGRFAVSEDFNDIITIGGYGQEQVNWRDRLIVTTALRGDYNSAFGKSFGRAWYPSLATSWVISEEPFFPKGLVNNLRLRAAIGQSGLQPQFRFAENFFNPVTVVASNADVPGITVGGNGLPDLRPERSTEAEAGFEASALAGRLGLDFTYYDKVSKDALLARILAPSVGQAVQRFENIGRLSNRGLELQVTADPVRTRLAALELVLSASTNRNRIDNLGGLPPILFDPQRHVRGFPAGGYWARPIIKYQDLNNDGIISRVNCPGGPTLANGPACEVTLGDTAVYLGSSIPTRLASLSSTLTVLSNLTFSALLDYKGGYKQYNDTGDFRCQFLTAPEANILHYDMRAQADCAARQLGSVAGYIEDGSFLKLREVSATYRLPTSVAHRVSASNLSLTLAGRELGTWTRYRGIDPEVNQNAGANFSQTDFLSQPPVRRFTASMQVGF